MKNHVIRPQRFGRYITCVTILDDGKPCGLDVQFVREVERPFWRHMSGAALANLHHAEIGRQREADNI